jgi:DNA helicase-2/ATP-dependent DNA helicase PcrA
MSGPSLPSRFLADIPQKLMTTQPRMDHRSAGSAARAPQTRKRAVAGATVTNGRPVVQPVAAEPPPPKLDLNTGDKVRHAKFGEGIVTASKMSGDDVEVTVAFADGNGIKRLLLSFAPLEKVT